MVNCRIEYLNLPSYLNKLNPQQREAVEAVNGPVLILAGAGSGKTRVITYRIAHLIDGVGVPPDSILAVTFTNKAAAEMASRVESLVGARSLAKPLISTFHSFCVRLLRRDIEALQIGGKGYRKDFVIYDEADQQNVVKAAMRRLGIDDKQLTPRNVLARISWAKNHMLDPQEVYLQSGDPKTERVAHIYEVYRQELAKSNALDFDDLLLYAVRVLKARARRASATTAAIATSRWTNIRTPTVPQYELMRMLAGSEHNVCAVGDEDQSIYSWRGADIRNILEFEQDFPEARIIRLEQNYRSTQNILQAASAVVSKNVRRKGKNLWTDRSGGAQIGYYEAPDGENEALFAADYIAKYLRQAGSEDRRDAAGGGAVPHQLAIAPGGRGDAPLSAELPRCGRFQLLRARRDQGHDLVPQGHPKSGRLDRGAARDQHPDARHRQEHHGDHREYRAGDRDFHVGRDQRGAAAQASSPAGLVGAQEF